MLPTSRDRRSMPRRSIGRSDALQTAHRRGCRAHQRSGRHPFGGGRLIGPVVAMQVLMAAAFAVFPPAVGALSLGIVGRDALPERQGRNQACNGVGNVLFALIEAAIGRFISLGATIFAIAGIGLLTATSMLGIRESDIDHARTREAGIGTAASLVSLLRDQRIATFAAAVLLFNLSNEAMLVLFGQLLSKGGNGPSLYLSAGIVISQLTLIGVSIAGGVMPEPSGASRVRRSDCRPDCTRRALRTRRARTAPAGRD